MQECEHSACVVEVVHVVIATRFEVHQQGGFATYFVKGLEGELAGDVGMTVDDCHEMDDCVGGASYGLQNRDGIEEGLFRKNGLWSSRG